MDLPTLLGLSSLASRFQPEAYETACKAGNVRVGSMFVTPGMELDGPRWIINFPTKENWRNPTKLEWVESGLVALKR